MKCIVTGGAGFIGSHLVDRLLEDGNEVVAIDNLSSGNKEFLEHAMKNPGFKLVEADLLEDSLEKYFEGADEIWHLAANPDVRISDPEIHVNQNFIATKRVLDAMIKKNVKNIFFTSSSTVYGEAVKDGKPTSESSALMPISLYGAMKMSSEAIIEAYCSTFGMKCWIFRLANVIGPRSTHGILTDLKKKLEKDRSRLEILGDGRQKKSYVYISDCIEAMIASRKSKEIVNIFNIGSDDWIDVKSISEMVCKKMDLTPEMFFTGGSRGWIGDVPLMILDINKIKKLGWTPVYNSRMAAEISFEKILAESPK